MRRSPPEFWERPGALPTLLAPLGWAYGAPGRFLPSRGGDAVASAGARAACVGNPVVAVRRRQDAGRNGIWRSASLAQQASGKRTCWSPRGC